jgi:hypothetical protein
MVVTMVSLDSYAKSYDSNCFREHITESLHINKERRKAYQRLTNGESDKVFNTLIASEVLTLAFATYFDAKAKPFQEKNMGLFCHEFMSLNRAPKFDPENKIRPSELFRPFDWKFYKDRLHTALSAGRIENVKKISIEALIELKKYPHYYCMTRHLIESIYRFAHFTPIREQEAHELGIKAPTKIMIDVMKIHLMPFGVSYKLDIWAQPIQESGIPMLCSEIPDLLFDLDLKELEPLKVKGHL